MEEALTTTAVKRIPLSVPSYGEEEIAEVMASLRSGNVTMGEKVRAFEEAWAAYVGVKHGIMVNSGSSANLVALAALGLQPGDEVITPALTWATTIFPIAQLGLVPVLVDVDLDTYNISLNAMEAAFTTKTRAIMPVHLLGNPCDMPPFVDEFCDGLYLLEDACEAHGAVSAGSKVGSFGELATFSFHFSHHISTIEGGMVVTDDEYFAEDCRSLRAFGWIRDLNSREACAARHPQIDPRFLFMQAGYNFRPTELQGAMGIHQVPRLEGFIAKRRENADYWNRELAAYGDWITVQEERFGTRHARFAYPVLVRPEAPFTRRKLQDFLETRGVETRQIEAGNMAIQPAMQYIKHRVSGTLTNAENIHNNAFFFGCHQGIGATEREYVAEVFHDFMRGY